MRLLPSLPGAGAVRSHEHLNPCSQRWLSILQNEDPDPAHKLHGKAARIAAWQTARSVEGRGITPKGGPGDALGLVIMNTGQNKIHTLENVPLEMEAYKNLWQPEGEGSAS